MPRTPRVDKPIILKSIAIENYGPFLERQEIPIDEEVTILIGGNETGKTHLLEALQTACLLPHPGATDITRLSNMNPGRPAVLTTTYEVKTDSLQDKLGALFQENPRAVVTVPADEKLTVVYELNRRFGISGEAAVARKIGWQGREKGLTDAEHRELLKFLPVPQVINPQNYMSPLSSEMGINVDGEGTLHHLLFELGDFFKDDYTEKVLAYPSETADAALDGVANRLTQLFCAYWSQAEVKIRLRLDNAKGKVLLFIEDPTKQPYDQLTQRGKGLQQFFYIWLLLQYKLDELHRRIKSEELKDRTVLLLIDEDLLNISTNLHPPAQRDLIRFLADFARQNALQIVLATHSPFLIDWNRPDRVRALFRNWKQSNQGVTVLSKLHKSKESADRLTDFEPALTSIGLYLGDFPFMGRKNLIVEGVTDQLILRTFIRKFSMAGLPAPDLNELSVLPGGGRATEYLVRYVVGCGAQAAALVDNDDAGKEITETLIKENLLPEEKILNIRQYLHEPMGKATIEDLLPRELYVKATNAYYEGKGGSLPFSFEEIKPRELSSGSLFNALTELFQTKFGENHKPDKFGITLTLCDMILDESTVVTDAASTGPASEYESVSKLFQNVQAALQTPAGNSSRT